MTFDEIRAISDQHVLYTYNRLPVAFVRGDGVRLWDSEGREYLDFLAGIAVCSLGHSHPRLVKAIQEQCATLMHTSNLYYIEPQAQAAALIAEFAPGYRSFFCNSGAEANEAAMKLARKWAKLNVGEERTEIITALDSFHGRTLAAVTATGQPKYQKGFEPLPGCFRYVQFNDLDALQKVVSARTAAIMLEAIQGESGVRVTDEAYLQGVRKICDEREILLILDEVQCGIARTGRMFCFEHYGIQPDIFTLAKGVAGGFPMGVMCASERTATGFAPGDHASTFGGNFLASAACLATLETIRDENLAANAEAMGGLLVKSLQDLDRGRDIIAEVRGKGLMIGVELQKPVARQIHDCCLQHGLILNAIGDRILRIVPPLILTEDDVDAGITILRESIDRVLARECAA